MGILIRVFHVLVFRKMKSSVHSEEDDFVPELHRNVHPRERPDWEETLSAMVNYFTYIKKRNRGSITQQKQIFLLWLYSFIQEIPVEQIIYSRHYSRLSGRAVNKTHTFPAFVELIF